MFTKQWMMAAAVALGVAGCGGGGDSEPTTSVSGVVVDGYLAGATVCLDVNANGKCDTGEASATTNASGVYSQSGLLGGNYTVSTAVEVGYTQGTATVSAMTGVSGTTTQNLFTRINTLSVSGVLAPSIKGDGLVASVVNHNQLSLIFQANSGLPFNIRSNQDLNKDGVNNDRPLNVVRNSGRLGAVYNLDARYSRYLPTGRSLRGELFVEAKNLLNRRNISGVNRVVTTDASGVPTADITNTTATAVAGLPFSGTAGYDQRLAQAGIKLTF